MSIDPEPGRDRIVVRSGRLEGAGDDPAGTPDEGPFHGRGAEDVVDHRAVLPAIIGFGTCIPEFAGYRPQGPLPAAHDSLESLAIPGVVEVAEIYQYSFD